MLREIDNLRTIADRCEQRLSLDPELADWLSRSLRDFLSHRVNNIDEALGIRAPRGGVSWWREEALRKRDAALRALAEECLVSRACSIRAMASEIAKLSRRYAASSWRFDQENDEMPARYAGTAKKYLWQAFRSGAPMPISDRQIRTIIGGIND